MEKHVKSLSQLCRLCGEKLHRQYSGRTSSAYVVREHATEINRCFGVDVRLDSQDIHPAHFCALCKTKLGRFKGSVSASASSTTSVAGSDLESNVGTDPMSLSESGELSDVLVVHTWMPHVEQPGQDCPTCAIVERVSKGGRPPKKKKFLGVSSKTVPIDVAVDMVCEDFLAITCESFVSDRSLSPSRFVAPLPALTCPICSNIVDRPVESPCCKQLYCGSCVWQYHHTTDKCMHCEKRVSLSKYLSPHPSLLSVLREQPVHCDFAGDTPLVGCPVVVPLADLKKHSSGCSVSRQATATSITPSSTVSDIMNATADMLHGDTGDKLLSKLITCKSVDGKLEQWTGRKPITWVKIATPSVASDEASSRSLRRREATIQTVSELVSGGQAGRAAQRAHSTRVMTKEARESLLQDAGVLPQGPASGVGLAIKADLQLPWYKLRKLQRYFREFGVPLESERTMRQQLLKELPFPLHAREEPLTMKDGAVCMCPVVSFPNLIDIVLHYVNMNDKAGNLVWPPGIPEDEIWVKIGGDHGYKSFKFCFELANTAHPNALYNTVPLLVFSAKDSPANLAATLSSYTTQIKELTGMKWKGKVIRVSLFGDYDFLTKSYGLSGAAGKHPCLMCHATKEDMQHAPDTTTAHPATQPRTLQTLQNDYQQFTANGSKISKAKDYKNVIRPAIFPIEVADVCIPALHLDLGIFPWLYEAMLKETAKVDVELAKLATPNVASSESFAEVVRQQNKLDDARAGLQDLEQQIRDTQQHLYWRVIHSQVADTTSQQHDALTQEISEQQSHWVQLAQTANKLKDDIAHLQDTLSTATVDSGPCVSSFEPVLRRHRIERQAYHSGAFIGNHVHKALQQSVINELTAAPLATLQELLPDASPEQREVIQVAEQLRERYKKLFSCYAECRALFSSCQSVREEDLAMLEVKIQRFMLLVREDIVSRLGKQVTPKLHLLECHTVPCMRRFGVSLGLLGEQGGESIHRKFKQLRSSLENMNSDVDRLRVLVTQYLTTTLPHYNSLILHGKKRKTAVSAQ